MQIHIGDMPADGLSLKDRLAIESFPALGSLTQQGECLFHSPVDVKLSILPVAGMFRVEGKLRTLVGLTCSRCLDAFSYSLASHFHVTYTRELPDGLGTPPEEQELKAEEMGLVSFAGETIDFRDMLQDQVVLSIPMQPRCRDDCQGLCTQCGTNLNLETCHCDAETVDPRLAVLKQLKFKA